MGKRVDCRLKLVLKYAKRLHEDGRYREAEGPFKEALEMERSLQGIENMETLTWLASAYKY
jgi:hypothetical protein